MERRDLGCVPRDPPPSEVLFRNAIDQRFPAAGSNDLLSICRSDVWLCDPEVLTDESRERVNHAICRLEREGRSPTRDRVVAALSFDFWFALFSGVYEELWRARLAGAFPYGNGKRRQVNQLGSPILHFRNRIAHHEAIFSADLSERHDQVLALAGVIDPGSRLYISGLSRVTDLLLECPLDGHREGVSSPGRPA